MNITRIESRPVQSNSAKFDFFVDFHGKVGDPNVNALLSALKGMTDKLLVLDEKEVLMTIEIIDSIAFEPLFDACFHKTFNICLIIAPGTLVPPPHF